MVLQRQDVESQCLPRAQRRSELLRAEAQVLGDRLHGQLGGRGHQEGHRRVRGEQNERNDRSGRRAEYLVQDRQHHTGELRERQERRARVLENHETPRGRLHVRDKTLDDISRQNNQNNRNQSVAGGCVQRRATGQGLHRGSEIFPE